MRTARALTVSPSMLCAGERWCLLPGGGACTWGEGVCSRGCLLQRGVLGWGGVICSRECLLPGDGIPSCTEADPPTVNRITHACETRMHSSRMRTGRTLTVFRWRNPPPKIWKNPPKKDTPPKIWRNPPKIRATSGAHPPKIRAKSGAHSPPVNRMTDRCKNITLAKTSFRPVNINLLQLRWGGKKIQIKDIPLAIEKRCTKGMNNRIKA